MAEVHTLTFKEPALRILENEHRYLRYLMEEWHAIVRDLEEWQMPVEEARLQLKTLRQKLYEFIEPFKNHTDKEENFFFPKLGAYIGYEQGPIVGIQEEHQEIEAYIGHLFHHTRGSIDQMDAEQIRTVARDAGEAFEVLTVHFVKEETVLFPMAEKQMTATDLDELAETMKTLIT